MLIPMHAQARLVKVSGADEGAGTGWQKCGSSIKWLLAGHVMSNKLSEHGMTNGWKVF